MLETPPLQEKKNRNALQTPAVYLTLYMQMMDKSIKNFMCLLTNDV